MLILSYVWQYVHTTYMSIFIMKESTTLNASLYREEATYIFFFRSATIYLSLLRLKFRSSKVIKCLGLHHRKYFRVRMVVLCIEYIYINKLKNPVEQNNKRTHMMHFLDDNVWKSYNIETVMDMPASTFLFELQQCNELPTVFSNVMLVHGWWTARKKIEILFYYELM